MKIINISGTVNDSIVDGSYIEDMKSIEYGG